MLITRSDVSPTSRSEEYNTNRSDDFEINKGCLEYQMSSRQTGDSDSFGSASEYNIL